MASDEKSGESASALPSLAIVPFKRRFAAPAIVLGLVEIIAVGYPLWAAFDLGNLGADTLVRTALPVAVGACVVWLTAITVWLLPLWCAPTSTR